MSALIFDIETVGEKFEDMDEHTQNVLTKWIRENSETEEEYNREEEKLKNRLGFSPLHGEIVAIGVLDSHHDKGAVYFQSPNTQIDNFEQDGVKFEAMSEREMLEKFWSVAEQYSTVSGFNSRSFDAPFINVRSAVHDIRPSVDLMAGRYLYQQRNVKHIDLLDQLSYYGAVWKKGNLHLWSRAFGISSPKEGDLQGDEVGAYFEAGKYTDIAEYNAADLYATRELYLKWNEYLNFQTG